MSRLPFLGRVPQGAAVPGLPAKRVRPRLQWSGEWDRVMPHPTGCVLLADVHYIVLGSQRNAGRYVVSGLKCWVVTPSFDSPKVRLGSACSEQHRACPVLITFVVNRGCRSGSSIGERPMSARKPMFPC